MLNMVIGAVIFCVGVIIGAGLYGAGMKAGEKNDTGINS